jgi:hypothetical protein
MIMEQPAGDSGQAIAPEGDGIRAAAQELARRRWAHRQESGAVEPLTNPVAAKPAPQAPKTTAPEAEEPATESALEDGQEVEGDEAEVEEGDELVEEGDSEEQTREPINLDDLLDDDEILVDGEPVTARELRESRMRLSDYTRKTQALAQQREVVTQREKLVAFSLGQTLQQVQGRLQELSATDWQALAQKNPQQFAAKKAEYEGTALKLQQVQEEQGKFLQQIKQFEDQMMRAQAQQAQKELKERIPGWNNGLYYSLVDYATQVGFQRDAVLKYTDPGIFILLQKAKAYDEAKKVTTKKSVKPSPKRSPKPTGAEAPQRAAEKDLDSIRAQAQQTGTIDAGIELLRAKRKLSR